MIVAPLHAGDAARLFPVLRDPRIYTFVPDEPPRTEQDLAARFARYLRGPADGAAERWLNWTARLRWAGAYVGTFQATVHWGERRAAIAYLLGPEFWGQGYASEGVRSLVRWLLASGDVDAVEATIDPGNARSLRLVRRLGFSLVRPAAATGPRRGSPTDELLFRRRRRDPRPGALR